MRADNSCASKLFWGSLETERILDPYRVTACKITNFEIFNFRSHDHQGHMTSKKYYCHYLIGDRAKRNKFWTLTRLLDAKLQILKFFVLLCSDWLI